jgi:hypothetical protein
LAGEVVTGFGLDKKLEKESLNQKGIHSDIVGN